MFPRPASLVLAFGCDWARGIRPKRQAIGTGSPAGLPRRSPRIPSVVPDRRPVTWGLVGQDLDPLSEPETDPAIYCPLASSEAT